MKDKWKEKTKLNKIEIKEIIVQVLLAIISVVVGLISKNFAWIVIAMLYAEIALIEYCNTKLSKAKDAIIELKDEEIEHKNDLIKTLLMRESRKRI